MVPTITEYEQALWHSWELLLQSQERRNLCSIAAPCFRSLYIKRRPILMAAALPIKLRHLLRKKCQGYVHMTVCIFEAHLVSSSLDSESSKRQRRLVSLSSFTGAVVNLRLFFFFFLCRLNITNIRRVTKFLCFWNQHKGLCLETILFCQEDADSLVWDVQTSQQQKYVTLDLSHLGELTYLNIFGRRGRVLVNTLTGLTATFHSDADNFDAMENLNRFFSQP